MAKFVLIDHSLESFAGHHYEYARRVLEAARDLGFSPVLAASRSLRVEVPPWIRTHSVYSYGFWERPPRTHPLLLALRDRAYHRYMTSLRYSWLALLVFRLNNSLLPMRAWLGRDSRCRGAAAPGEHPPPAQSLRGPRRDRRNSALANAFCSATQELVRREPLSSGDHVFIPNISPNDLSGLAKFFSRGAPHGRWHLLFRRNLYQGQEEDYAAEDAHLDEVRRDFQRLADSARPPRCQLRFWTDTDRLTAQYNRLRVASFRTLTIPANPRFALEQTRASRAPLHIVYLGDARTEKGYHLLPELVERLWDDYVFPGRVRFTIQSNFNSPPGEPGPLVAYYQLKQWSEEKVRLIRDPLSVEEYAELLLSSDVILILYDRSHYYARSSGILVEALAAGRPVVIPQGTWMSSVAGEGQAVVYDKPEEIPVAVRSLLENYEFHRAQAGLAAERWHRQYSPRRLVESLMCE